MISLEVQILLLVTSNVVRVRASCGHPSIPVGSVIIQPAGHSDISSWAEGSEVQQDCAPGWLRVGGDTARSCGRDGRWTNFTLRCEENVALNQPSLQSGTFLHNLPHLAVDGDRATCSSTLRSGEQRWWQVQITTNNIDRVQVITSPPSLVTTLSVFLIELLAGGKAKYKPCSLQFNKSNTFQEFSCGQEQGEYVYIRDDRLTEEHLTICEVTVVPVRDAELCGTPSSPALGAVTLSGKEARYSCRPGLTLVGSGEKECRGGEWLGQTPDCVEMFCPRPQSPAHGRLHIVNEGLRFSWGARVFVLCDEGFVLSGNNTRQCVEGGLWTGPPPSCQPILCHHPPAVVNGLVQLINGSTVWQAVASYQCLPGYYNYGQENSTTSPTAVFSSCQLNGTWSPVSLTCMSLSGLLQDLDGPWRGKREVDPSTIITISILSTIIILVIISIIATIMVKRRKASLDNARKISTSSTNQLLYNEISNNNENFNDRNSDKNSSISSIYTEWKRDPNKDYAVILKHQESDTEDHIYSTLNRQDTKSRDSFENDDDDVYATVNFSRNSITVISDDNSEKPEYQENKKVISYSNDVTDLYAKVDVNKKKKRR